MSNELDLPLLPSADQIRRREFATVRRGYDPDQVRDYLAAVAQQVENLENESREMKLRSETAPRPDTKGPAMSAPATAPTTAQAASTGTAPTGQADPYEAIAKRFAGVLGTADKEASRIVEDAKAEAAKVLAEARAEADRVRLDAQSTAERARAEGENAFAAAKQEADRILSTLTSRRRQLVGDLQDVRTRLLAVAEELNLADDEAPAIIPSSSSMGTPAVIPAASSTGSGKPAAPRAPEPTKDATDPRYEDLWVSKDETVELPDLALTDLDFDDDKPRD